MAAPDSPDFEARSQVWEPDFNPEEGELPNSSPGPLSQPALPEMEDLDLISACLNQAVVVGEGLGEQIQLLLSMKNRLFFLKKYLSEIKERFEDKLKQNDTSPPSEPVLPREHSPPTGAADSAPTQAMDTTAPPASQESVTADELLEAFEKESSPRASTPQDFMN